MKLCDIIILVLGGIISIVLMCWICARRFWIFFLGRIMICENRRTSGGCIWVSLVLVGVYKLILLLCFWMDRNYVWYLL